MLHLIVPTIQHSVCLLTFSGLVSPLNGHSVFSALDTSESPGLFDRLIADECSRAGLEMTLRRHVGRVRVEEGASYGIATARNLWSFNPICRLMSSR